MSKGKWILTISLLVIIVALSMIKYSNYKKTEAKLAMGNKPGGKSGPIAVTGFITSFTKLSNQVSSNGTILAGDEVQLQAEVAGRIVFLNIQEGSFVNKGILLMKLNDQDLQAQLKKSIAQQKIAVSNERRLAELLKTNGISQQEYDGALNTLNNASADIELIQSQIAKTEIRAPFSGKIGLRNVSVGAYVSPSTVISSLQNLSVLKIDLSLPEKYASIIKTNDLLQCNIDGLDKSFAARVIALEPQIDESTRNIKVRAIIEETNAKLIPGAYVKINLMMADIPNAIMIPANAIIPDAKNKKVIVSSEGKAKFVIVETGIRTENEVEVISGLQVNDTIVTSGILQVKPNTVLRFTKLSSKIIN